MYSNISQSTKHYEIPGDVYVMTRAQKSAIATKVTH